MWGTTYTDARRFLYFILQNSNPLVTQVRTQVPECLFYYVWDLEESHMYIGKRQGFLWVRIWGKKLLSTKFFQIHIKVTRSLRVDIFLFSRLNFGGIIAFITKPTITIFFPRYACNLFFRFLCRIKTPFQRHLVDSVPRACDSASQGGMFQPHFGCGVHLQQNKTKHTSFSHALLYSLLLVFFSVSSLFKHFLLSWSGSLQWPKISQML